MAAAAAASAGAGGGGMLAGGGGVGRGAACPCSLSIASAPPAPVLFVFTYIPMSFVLCPRVTSTAMRVAPPGGWGGEWLGAPPGLLSEGRGRYRGATKRRDQDLQSCAARSGSHVDISSPEIRMAAAAGQAWGRGDTAAVARLSGSATPACCRAHGGPLGAANDWQSGTARGCFACKWWCNWRSCGEGLHKFTRTPPIADM